MQPLAFSHRGPGGSRPVAHWCISQQEPSATVSYGCSEPVRLGHPGVSSLHRRTLQPITTIAFFYMRHTVNNRLGTPLPPRRYGVTLGRAAGLGTLDVRDSTTTSTAASAWPAAATRGTRWHAILTQHSTSAACCQARTSQSTLHARETNHTHNQFCGAGAGKQERQIISQRCNWHGCTHQSNAGILARQCVWRRVGNTGTHRVRYLCRDPC